MMESILKKYLKPLKKLSESLPGHNIELQVEVLGSNSPTNGNKKLVHIKKMLPYRNPKLRLLEQSPLNPYNSFNDNALRQGNKRSYARDGAEHPPGQPIADQGQVAKSPASPPTASTPQSTPQSQTLTPTPTPPPSTPAIVSHSSPSDDQNTDSGPNEDPNRKPVYMEDLKKALEDFEQRFYAKQSSSSPAHGNRTKKDTTTTTQNYEEVEEGKKPLLKKDLWMALGMKFLTGCQDRATKPSQSIDKNMFTTARTSQYIPYNPDGSYNPNNSNNDPNNKSPYNPDGSYNYNYNNNNNLPVPTTSNPPSNPNNPYIPNNPNNAKNPTGQFSFDQNTVITGMNPRINKIMQLLKKGVNVQRDMSKPGDDVQWLQVKIPTS